MDKIKELVRKNKKFVAVILIALVGFAGVKLAPETADTIATVIVDICCKEAPPSPPAPEPTP